MKLRGRITGSLTDEGVRRSAVWTVIGDVALIVAMTVFLMLYISRNNVNTYNQNVENIQNIAKAEAGLIQIALENTEAELGSAYRHCTGKSLDEILDYLSVIRTEGSEYQLLRLDAETSTERFSVYRGFSTVMDGDAFRQVKYGDTALSASIKNCTDRPEGEICFSRNFTNNTDGLRYFAVFCGISVAEDGGTARYWLVKPQKEERLLQQLQIYSEYSELSLAVCYTDGKYLARDNSYRADNFYDYLSDYNGLTLDERDAVRASVLADEDGVGVLTFVDCKGRDAIFAYVMTGVAEQRQIIVSVPVSEFVSGRLLSLFPLIIILFLVALLAFNMWRLLDIVRMLRQSVERERLANASKSSFLSRMSHEIRTPLNAIIGYNTISLNELKEAKTDAAFRQAEMKVADSLSKSGVASKHLLSIINDVLDMSAIESGKIKLANDRFDFKALITSLVTVFYSQAKEKNVVFDVVFDTLTEEWFIGDQMRTGQILTNLLSNAIKFTPEGGSVTLKICQPEASANAAHIRFTVADTGIGMTEEYLSHIWAPFEQADSSISRRFGGTGLGLSITKSLIDLMGGTISVDSRYGAGTTFRVDLTFTQTEQPDNAHAYDFGSVSALVVDDDQSTCDYVLLLFGRCGAKCRAVTSGEAALAAVAEAKAEGTPFSVCIVDWKMPHMDGIETVRRMRRIVGEEMPIIVLTAYDFTEMRHEAESAGVTRFLQKPLFQSALFDLLADVCGVREPERSEPVAKTDFAGAHVLLAEDNRMNMEIAKNILKTAGLTVDGAWNGKEAVEKFAASPAGTYRLILMDVHMPEMDGYEASRAIRACAHPEAATIPIVAMTADVFAEDVAEAHASGMNAHVGKPIDVPTLFATLRQFIR